MMTMKNRQAKQTAILHVCVGAIVLYVIHVDMCLSVRVTLSITTALR